MLEADKIMEEGSVISFFTLAVFRGRTWKLRAGEKMDWSIVCGFRKELLQEKNTWIYFC